MKIRLIGFKCYEDASFTFEAGVKTLIQGQSGKGKTSLLEGIYYALYGEVKKPCMFGTTKCEVQFEWQGMQIKRQHGPKLLTLKYQDKDYVGEVAQSIINGNMGNSDVFLSTCYSRQSTRHPILAGTKEEKLKLIRDLCFNDDEVSDLKMKAKDLLIGEKKLLDAAEKDSGVAEGIYKNMVKEHAVDGCDVTQSDSDLRTASLSLTKEISELNSLKERLDKLSKIPHVDVEKVSSEIDGLTNASELVRNELKGFSEFGVLKAKLLGKENVEIEAKKLRAVIEEEQLNVSMRKRYRHDLEKLSPMTSIDTSVISHQIDTLKSVLSVVPRNNTMNKNMKARLDEINLKLGDDACLDIDVLKKKQAQINRWKQLEVTDHELFFEMKRQELVTLKQELEDINYIGDLKCPGCKKTLKLQSTPVMKLLIGSKTAREKRDTSLILSDIRKVDDILAIDCIEGDYIETIELLTTRASLVIALKDVDFTQIDDVVTMPQEEFDEKEKALKALCVELDKAGKHNNNTEVNNGKMKDLTDSIDKIVVSGEVALMKERLEVLEELIPIERELKKHREVEVGVSSLTVEEGKSKKDQVKAWSSKVAELQGILQVNKLNVDTKAQIVESIGERQVSVLEDALKANKTLIKQKKVNKSRLDAVEKKRLLTEKSLRVDAVTFLVKSMKEAENMLLDKVVEFINVHVNIILQKMFDENISVVFSTLKVLKSTKETKNEFNMTVEYKDDTMSWQDLSGGQLDRLSLAILLTLNRLRKSDLLILDESVNTLDNDSKEKVTDVLAEENTTILFVSHNAIAGQFESLVDI